MRTVTVIYHREDDGTWWADSPDFTLNDKRAGFAVGGKDFREARRMVREALDFAYEGEPVDLREAYDGLGVAEVSWSTEAPTVSMTTTSATVRVITR